MAFGQVIWTVIVVYGLWLGSMDAEAVLALLGDGDAAAAGERRPRRGRPPRPPASDAMRILALIGEAPRRRTPGARSHMAANRFRGNWLERRVVKRAQAQALKFHRSGRAVTRDDLMLEPARVLSTALGQRKSQVRGRGAWKRWTPEAIQRAVFSQTPAKAFAEGHGPAASGQRGALTVAACKASCAKAILEGDPLRPSETLSVEAPCPPRCWGTCARCKRQAAKMRPPSRTRRRLRARLHAEARLELERPGSADRK